jgi:hypothetical protein
MADSQKVEGVRLWISYPWIGKEERDFTYLVDQLKDADIEAIYDSLQLLPEMHLWQRTLQRLQGVGFDGWLYILTHQCFTRRTCSEELTAAIDRTLQHMGLDFPVVGLLYGIATQHVPPMLRTRPCISLADPDWKHQISDVFKRRAPRVRKGIARDESRFIWKVHSCFCDDPSLTAIEVRSKEGSVPYWRFAIPAPAQAIQWGQGPSGRRDLVPARFAEATGSGRCQNRSVAWFGAARNISNAESAYAVFSGPLPDFICFGPAMSPFGPPGKMEVFWTASAGKTADQCDIGSAG